MLKAYLNVWYSTRNTGINKFEGQRGISVTSIRGILSIIDTENGADFESPEINFPGFNSSFMLKTKWK